MKVYVNPILQWGAEFAFGMPNEAQDSMLLIGLHGWGARQTVGGFKAAVEYKHFEVENEQLVEGSTVSLAVTAPRFEDNKPTTNAPSWSLSAFKQYGMNHSACAVFEASPSGECVLTAGGTRKIDDTCKLRGKLNTKGVLGLALELAGTKDLAVVGDKAGLTLNCEVASIGPLNPKVGAVLQLSS